MPIATNTARRYDAVFLDALGTMLELEPPWRHLAPLLGVPEDESLIAAVRKEMAYFRDHSHEGRDRASLADLRERSAAVLAAELGRPVDAETMMAAIRFRLYPDTRPGLDRLREAGVAIVCVSNWDCSLPEVVARVRIADLLDGVVTSAGAGARKPDPAIFRQALELASCEPERALHVGDTPAEDREAAAAAGLDSLLIDRAGGGDIASLEEIAERVRQHPAS